MRTLTRVVLPGLAWGAAVAAALAQTAPRPAPDARVKAFLEEQEYRWRDMNVPSRDGQFLHDLIVGHKYRRALEIGTSTGHSAIWIAWALSKTGGKLVTIEIDEERHREALANFEEAGVAAYIDARLADAHDLVREIEGPFDFVFSDADKAWHRQYFVDLAPKVAPGGCYVTHNVGRRHVRGDYLEFMESRPDSPGDGRSIRRVDSLVPSSPIPAAGTSAPTILARRPLLTSYERGRRRPASEGCRWALDKGGH
jgi:predicted O-methyltransferase YrrM